MQPKKHEAKSLINIRVIFVVVYMLLFMDIKILILLLLMSNDY